MLDHGGGGDRDDFLSNLFLSGIENRFSLHPSDIIK